MSEVISKYVTCPKCAQQSTVELICSVNTEQEPQVRQRLLSDEAPAV